jgi:bifunctional non-homologous end joining protein LigD
MVGFAHNSQTQVEDHPREYGNFEGIIPEGEYGGGTVIVWDNGEWFPESDDVENALRKGDLKFTLQGKKLRGSWVLVRTRGYGSRADKSWLRISPEKVAEMSKKHPPARKP